MLFTVAKIISIMTAELILVTGVYALITRIAVNGAVQDIRYEIAQRYATRDEAVNRTAYEIKHEELVKEALRMGNRLEELERQIVLIRADFERVKSARKLP